MLVADADISSLSTIHMPCSKAGVLYGPRLASLCLQVVYSRAAGEWTHAKAGGVGKLPRQVTSW